VVKKFAISPEIYCLLIRVFVVSERSSTTTTFTSRLEAAGLQVHNIMRDGNCMFASIAHQLQLCGIKKSAAQVRQDIVDFIAGNPVLVCVGLYFLVVNKLLSETQTYTHFASGGILL